MNARDPLRLDPDPLTVEIQPVRPCCPMCGGLIFAGDYRNPKTGRCVDCVGRGGSALGWVAAGAMVVTAALAAVSALLAIAVLGWILAAPRAAADPTTEAPRDVSGLRDGASSLPLPGVPLAREVVEGPGAPIPLSGGPWEARVRLGRGGTVAALAAPLIANGAIGTPLLGGTASHVGTQYGDKYLALPEHRWGQPGLLVRVTGAGGSVVRRSTDAGPDLQRQREGRVVDLNKWDFDKVCGVAPGEPDPGLCAVTVEYLADIPLPATDTAEALP